MASYQRTHNHGQRLDFLLYRSTPNYFQTLTATYGLLVLFTVMAELKVNQNQVGIIVFDDDIVKSQLITNPKHLHFVTVKTLLDLHAPVRPKSVKRKPLAPLNSCEINNGKMRR